MQGEQLLHAVALAMLVYATAVEGGCCNVIRLLGPVDAGGGVGACAADRLDIDGRRVALRRWRQPRRTDAEPEDGSGRH
jgi:hypothetical protein